MALLGLLESKIGMLEFTLSWASVYLAGRELPMLLGSVLLLLADRAVSQDLWCQLLQRRRNKCSRPESLKNLLILYRIMEKGQGAYFESYLFSRSA